MEKAIESVINQSLQNWELLILDDCSTDKSKDYLQNLSDQRVRVYYNQSNKGLFYNLNFLIKQSKGHIIKLWSQDDIMYSNCLEETYKFHQKHETITFSYCNRDIIDENGKIVNAYDGWDNTPEIISPYLHSKIFLYTGSIAGNIANVAINKWALQKYGLFREDMKYAADLDMWERLTRIDNIGRIDKTLIQLRNHSKQLSKKRGFAVHQLNEDLEIFTRLYKRIDPSLVKYAKKCREWKREVYYMSVFINLIKQRQFFVAKQYYAGLVKYSYFVVIFLKFILVKFKFVSPVKLDITEA